MFNNDIDIYNIDTLQITILKQIDVPIMSFYVSNEIEDFKLYSLRALVILIPLRGLRITKAITLERLNSARQHRTIELVRLNTLNRIRDISIVVEAIQLVSSRGLPPNKLTAAKIAIIAIATTIATATPKGRQNKFFDNYSIFQTKAFNYQKCKDKNYYKVITRRGVAYYVYKGTYY